MKTKITDTSNAINAGGRAEKWWKGKPVKSRSSSWTRNQDDVDLQSILQRYNLKGFEFGNWLNNNERYDRVLACEDSLAELSKIIGSKNLGIESLVGIAFGARGMSKAAAHYEPGYNMINITKMDGDGCLAHEYGHALDYNLGKYVDQNKRYNYLSGGRSVLKTLTGNQGGNLRNTMNELVDKASSMLNVRLDEYLDKKFGKNPKEENMRRAKAGMQRSFMYWRYRHEIFARLFEQCCCYKLKQKQRSDMFLTSSWAFYTKSNAALFYWPEAEFKKLLPKMDKLIREVKKALNSK